MVQMVSTTSRLAWAQYTKLWSVFSIPAKTNYPWPKALKNSR
jgi:hypothetical protein